MYMKTRSDILTDRALSLAMTWGVISPSIPMMVNANSPWRKNSCGGGTRGENRVSEKAGTMSSFP